MDRKIKEAKKSIEDIKKQAPDFKRNERGFIPVSKRKRRY